MASFMSFIFFKVDEIISVFCELHLWFSKGFTDLLLNRADA